MPSRTSASMAFIFGRSSRMVPTPSATSSRTVSPAGSRHLRQSCLSRRVRFVSRSLSLPLVGPGLWRVSVRSAAVWPGRMEPLGATWAAEATKFAFHAPLATDAWVCLFDEDGAETRHQLTERTLDTWHGASPGVARAPATGSAPTGRGTPRRGCASTRQAAARPVRARDHRPASTAPTVGLRPSTSTSPAEPRRLAPHVPRRRRAATTLRLGRRSPARRRRWADTVIYEAARQGPHEAAHPHVPEHLRGTYAGLAHPAVVDYLRDLGVTTVELLPVHQFVSEPRLLARRDCVNYWGYNTVGFFAPHAAYSSRGPVRGQQVHRVQGDGAALHEAGLEVFLDVVYNHTAEGGADGPTLSFRGYRQRRLLPAAADGRRTYVDYTGCGNTVDCSEPAALQLVLDSLRYWVTRDARRRLPLRPRLGAGPAPSTTFDMRSTSSPPSAGPACSREVKLIAEPWDVGAGRLPASAASRTLWASGTTVPRHDARLLAGRDRRRRATRRPLGSPAPPTSIADDGRCRTPRSTSSPPTTGSPLARPGELRPQAQRGQRRGQPRRHRRQPLLEPRRRGRDRRRRHPARPPQRRCATSSAPCSCSARRADARRRATRSAAPSAATTTRTARTRTDVGRLALRRRLARRSYEHDAPPAAAAPRRTRCCGQRPLRFEGRPTAGAAARTRLVQPGRLRMTHRRLGRTRAAAPCGMYRVDGGGRRTRVPSSPRGDRRDVGSSILRPAARRRSSRSTGLPPRTAWATSAYEPCDRSSRRHEPASAVRGVPAAVPPGRDGMRGAAAVAALARAIRRRSGRSLRRWPPARARPEAQHRCRGTTRTV